MPMNAISIASGKATMTTSAERSSPRNRNSTRATSNEPSTSAVVAVRMLTHCEQWEQLVAEMCRVSRGPVITDYPTSQSLNAAAPALFKAKKKYEKNTREWKLFRHQVVAGAFATVGLTTGITQSLTEYGKVWIILMMFAGRVGPVTLALALALRTRKGMVKYPEGKIIIG